MGDFCSFLHYKKSKTPFVTASLFQQSAYTNCFRCFVWETASDRYIRGSFVDWRKNFVFYKELPLFNILLQFLDCCYLQGVAVNLFHTWKKVLSDYKDFQRCYSWYKIIVVPLFPLLQKERKKDVYEKAWSCWAPPEGNRRKRVRFSRYWHGLIFLSRWRKEKSCSTISKILCINTSTTLVTENIQYIEFQRFHHYKTHSNLNSILLRMNFCSVTSLHSAF